MREFRIKVNNEKTYVVKANDYNQAVKTLHSKLRDFDLTNFLALKRSLELRIGEEIDFDKLEEYVNKLPKDKNGKKNVDVKEVIKCCIKAKDNAVSDSISKYNGEDAIRTNGFVRIKEDGDWTSYKYNGSSDFDDAVFKIHQYNPSLIAFVSNGNKTITVRNKYLNDADDTTQGEIEVLKFFGFDYKDGRWVKESNNNTIIAQPDYHYVSVIGPGDTEKHCKKYQYQSAGMLKKIIASNIKDSSIKDFGNFKTFAEVEKYLNSKGYKIDSADKPLPGQRLKEKYITAYKNGKQKYIELFQYSNGDYEIMTSLSDSSISDKLIESGSKEALSKNIATEIKAGKDPKQAAAIAYSVQRENDASTGYKYRITNNGSKWYYETTFPDGHTTLTGPYSSKQETEQYFHKHRPTEKLTDANRYNKGQKIQTSAGIHEIIGYDPVKPDVHTNRIEYSYRLKTPNGTYTNIPDWQLEELVKLGRYKLIDSDNNKKQQLKAELDKLDKEWDRLDNLGRPTEHITAEMEAIREELKKLEDCSTVMTKDADSVKVEKIIRKEKSALGITYYLFQTKSNSGATIYYEVTDKTYNGEPTYSGGGIISFSLQSANDSLDSHLLYDKLVSKYGKEAGRKRFLLGKNDSAIKDSNSIKNHISYDDLKRTINRVMEEGNDKDTVNILIGQLAELKKDYEKDINNSKLDKEETKQHYNEYKRLVNNYKNSHISKEYTNAVNSFLSAIKDSNIKDAGEEIRYLEGMKFNGVPYTGWAVQHWTDGYYTFDGKKPYIPSGGRDALLSIFKQGGFIGQWKGIKPDKGFESYFRHSTAVPAVRDSNNIKNRKSYTIKVGDKQYKIFAESESEAINKYIKSKKQ